MIIPLLQYIELKPALIRNCLLALLSMFIVSFIMIPSWGAAFAIVAAIFSIDIGINIHYEVN